MTAKESIEILSAVKQIRDIASVAILQVNVVVKDEYLAFFRRVKKHCDAIQAQCEPKTEGTK